MLMNIVQAGKKILSVLLICFACSTVAVARSYNGILLQKIDKAKGLAVTIYNASIKTITALCG
jgi:hypothetical protein